MIQKVRGTKDLLDLRLYNFTIDKIKKLFQLYNFTQIQTPILEPTNLFIRSLGKETDVVSKEMYIFPPNGKDNDESICLRPEATASTIRAYFENNITQKPWKVFSYGPMFRHERPQKGRYRQFTQINTEIINSSSIAQDAQFIKMLDMLFSEYFNLENYVIKLNFLGTTKDRKKYTQKLYNFLQEKETLICKTCKERKEKNILRIFDCKSEQCQKIYQNAPKITDELCDESKKEWMTLKEILQMLSVNFIEDPKLVRGLDYYNKTVFEFDSKELGAQSAFCGGGRYELAKELGEQNQLPSIGAAIGLERLLMLLEKNLNKLTLQQEPALHTIIPMSNAQDVLALLLAYELQSHNLCTDILLDKANMTNMMKKANKMGSKFVLIIGENEQKNGTVSIKNMQSGKTQIIKQDKVVVFLKK